MTTRDNEKNKKVCAIIAAAGGSSRMNFTDGGSKQFVEICGKSVIERTLGAFERCRLICEVVISARLSDIDRLKEMIEAAGFRKVRHIVEGGKSRQESVLNALEAVSGDIEYAAVHDGARCLINPNDIERVVRRAFETGSATAAARVTDTIKYAECTDNGINIIKKTIDRNFLWAVQTPQVFRRDLYISAIEYIRENLGDKGIETVTDDCSILEYAGHDISLVECSRSNIKITELSDIKFAEAILLEKKSRKQ